jgi:hypothetical protein
MHLLVHLVEELELCGWIHTHWMYPIERYLKTLKGYVWNKARPKGSMVEGYALEEALAVALNTYKISQPQGKGYGMTKKTLPWLMKFLKEVGNHSSWL